MICTTVHYCINELRALASPSTALLLLLVGLAELAFTGVVTINLVELLSTHAIVFRTRKSLLVILVCPLQLLLRGNVFMLLVSLRHHRLSQSLLVL